MTLTYKDFTAALLQDLHRHSTDSASLICNVGATFNRPAKSPLKCHQAQKLFEHFYLRMVQSILNHYTRPANRAKQPRTYAFIDFTGTRGIGTAIETSKTETPHLHSVMIIHPDTREAFLNQLPAFEALFPRLHPLNQSIHFDIDTDPKRSLEYASKLLRFPPQHLLQNDQSLWFMLPKALSEK